MWPCMVSLCCLLKWGFSMGLLFEPSLQLWLAGRSLRSAPPRSRHPIAYRCTGFVRRPGFRVPILLPCARVRRPLVLVALVCSLSARMAFAPTSHLLGGNLVNKQVSPEALYPHSLEPMAPSFWPACSLPGFVCVCLLPRGYLVPLGLGASPSGFPRRPCAMSPCVLLGQVCNEISWCTFWPPPSATCCTAVELCVCLEAERTLSCHTTVSAWGLFRIACGSLAFLGFLGRFYVRSGFWFSRTGGHLAVQCAPIWWRGDCCGEAGPTHVCASGASC